MQVVAQLAVLDKAIPQTMIMEEKPTPRPAFVLKRGQYDQPGETFRPGVPGSLPPLPAGVPANRLGLARWLVDPANPLTARVTVNRWWQMYFGTGSSKRSKTSARKANCPAHPELLDWLATELVRTRLERQSDCRS